MTRHTGRTTLPPAGPPQPVPRPSNIQSWDSIAFLHWPFEPVVVQRLLPAGLEVHIFDGAAWVGVTPFQMRVRPLDSSSTVSEFPETNVRTYVLGPGGRPGLHFIHMEVGVTWFTSLRVLGLPYVRRDMEIELFGDRLTYLSRPHRSGGPESHSISVEATKRVDAGEPRARFLTARWRAFHAVGSLLMCTGVQHRSWELFSAIVEHDGFAGLFERLGLEPQGADPLAHYSPGVEARLSWPRLAR